MHAIVQDGDGHWYVIPADCRRQWSEFDTEADDFYLPDWARPIGGGPQLVVFGDYKIG